MGFVKVLKNKAYFKRFQVKNKRRRQGKTDYFARRRMIQQDKNKYDTKKYRLVVRRSNKRVLCQIVYSTIEGDRVICAASSKELMNFGVECGLSNYSAHYCTGLLVARRLLKDLKIDSTFSGVEAPNGDYFDINETNPERRPFKAFLDCGLIRTTTGNRTFGALKGAADGGLCIPHSENRWPGFKGPVSEVEVSKKGKKDKKVVEKFDSKTAKPVKEGGSLDAAAHREHIMGLHVQKYMDILKKKDKSLFDKQFSKWAAAMSKAKVTSLEDLYKKAHAAIRKDPTRKITKNAKPTRKDVSKKDGNQVMTDSKNRKWLRTFKLTKEQRKARVAAKIQAAMQKNL